MKMWAPWCALFCLFVSVPVQNALGPNCLNTDRLLKCTSIWEKVKKSGKAHPSCARLHNQLCGWSLRSGNGQFQQFTSRSRNGKTRSFFSMEIGSKLGRGKLERMMDNWNTRMLPAFGSKIVKAPAAIRIANDDNENSHFTLLKFFFATLGLAVVLFLISTFFYVLYSILGAWLNQLLPHIITH